MRSQIFDLIPEEFTLGLLKLQIVLPEVLKHNVQAMYVLLFCSQKDSHVIHVNQTTGQVQLTQAVLHQSLEHCQGITQPNGMYAYSKNPMFPMVKAVHCFEASSMAICQNPAFKSKQEKYPVPTRFLIASSGGVGKSLSWFSHLIYES